MVSDGDGLGGGGGGTIQTADSYSFRLTVTLPTYLCKRVEEERNRPFPSCCEPHYESEAKCKTFHMKINFVCI